jgi:CDGSH-type Zn-finger protein
MEIKNYKIVITKNGPYIVSGGISIQKEAIVTDKDGYPLRYEKGENYPKEEEYWLCRCGQSKNKPFCDSTHKKIIFDGTETASRKKYLNEAETLNGPKVILKDNFPLCSGAGFCNARDGNTWDLTIDSKNPKSKKFAIQQACDCPSGRLVIFDKKSKKSIEPKFDPSISLIEEPRKKVSGALWVKGKIPIESSDGTNYEIRNRVTLCRCGKSLNKPFCDGTHRETGFNDRDKSLK